MANPLKALAELEQKSGEDVDPKVIQEIKTLLNKNIEVKAFCSTIVNYLAKNL